MKAESILKKISAAASTAVLAVALTACAHHPTTVGGTADDYGHVATAPETATNNTATDPNMIAGPAKVDSTGNVYTSSSVGGAGNGSSIGTNTNVSVVPKKTADTTGTVAYSNDSTLTTTTDTTPVTTTVTTPVTTADTTISTNTTSTTDTTANTDVAMSSSAQSDTTNNNSSGSMSSTTNTDTTSDTTTTTTKHHRRMRKD